MTVTSVPGLDPLRVLREYSALAPWSLRDLTVLAAAILDASGVYPLNSAARARPTERTIRFYMAQGLVSPPEGRGTSATYTYRHLLQVLAIKLRQMEGATLDHITRDLGDQAGDVLERRVASALGPNLPPPSRLDLRDHELPRGKVARAFQEQPAALRDATPRVTACRHVALGNGLEVILDQRHPLLRRYPDDAALIRALQAALAPLAGEPPFDSDA